MDVKPMEFPKKGIKEGPGLFSGEKGYFEVVGESKKEVSTKADNDEKPKNLDYDASK
jgi:hypothetical protein